MRLEVLAPYASNLIVPSLWRRHVTLDRCLFDGRRVDDFHEKK